MKYARKNRVDIDSAQLKHAIQEFKKEEDRNRNQIRKNYGILDMFRTRRLRKRSLICGFNWWVYRLYSSGVFHIFLKSLSVSFPGDKYNECFCNKPSMKFKMYYNCILSCIIISVDRVILSRLFRSHWKRFVTIDGKISGLVYSRNITNLPPLELLHTGNGLFRAINLISGTTFLYLCTIVEWAQFSLLFKIRKKTRGRVFQRVSNTDDYSYERCYSF